MRFLLSLCCVGLWAVSLVAGTHAVYEVTRAPAASEVNIHIQGNAMRIAYEGEQGEMIFDGDRNLLLMLDHQNQQYVELNGRMVAAFAEQLSGQYERIEKAKDDIEQRLAKVPEEYRGTMREILHQKLAALPQPGEPVVPPKTKDLGAGETIAGYETHHYEIWENEAKDMELWTTDPAGVGLKSFSGFQQIAAFFQEIKRISGGDTFLSQVDSPFRMFMDVKGFPVQIEKFRDGKSVEISRLSKVSPRQYLPDFFSVPSGYQVLNPFQGR